MKSSTTSPVTPYREWLGTQKEAAKARGGKPIKPEEKYEPCDLSAIHGPEERRLKLALHRAAKMRVKGRKPGEILNPMTGEIVTGCVSSDRLDAWRMEAMGWIRRELIQAVLPSATRRYARVEYDPRWRVAPYGMSEGYVIQITMSGTVTRLLVTPRGQQALSEWDRLQAA